MDFELAGQIAAIVVIDLVLSGDNAMVIGMASRGLSPENRRRAITIGGLGAVGLRVIFTIMAALLLDIPLLQAGGAILLIWISFKLLKPAAHSAEINEAESLTTAIKTIILADVVMSLDNILAVGGAAHGDIELLIFGLVLSIPILLAGSAVIARVMGRLPILVYVGVIVLVVTAVRMFFEDEVIHDVYEAPVAVVLGLSALLATIVIGVSLRQSSAIAVAEGSEIAELFTEELQADRTHHPSWPTDAVSESAAINQEVANGHHSQPVPAKPGNPDQQTMNPR